MALPPSSRGGGGAATAAALDRTEAAAALKRVRGAFEQALVVVRAAGGGEVAHEDESGRLALERELWARYDDISCCFYRLSSANTAFPSGSRCKNV